MTQLDNNYNADLLDAMADMAEEQEQAMRESSQSDWSLVDRTDGIAEVDLLNQSINSEWTLIEDNNRFVGFTVTNKEDINDGNNDS